MNEEERRVTFEGSEYVIERDDGGWLVHRVTPPGEPFEQVGEIDAAGACFGHGFGVTSIVLWNIGEAAGLVGLYPASALAAHRARGDA